MANTQDLQGNDDDDDDDLEVCENVFEERRDHMENILEKHGLSKEDDDAQDPEFLPSNESSEDEEEKTPEEETSKKTKNQAKKPTLAKVKNQKSAPAITPASQGKVRKKYKRQTGKINIPTNNQAKLPDQVMSLLLLKLKQY